MSRTLTRSAYQMKARGIFLVERGVSAGGRYGKLTCTFSFPYSWASTYGRTIVTRPSSTSPKFFYGKVPEIAYPSVNCVGSSMTTLSRKAVDCGDGESSWTKQEQRRW